MNYKNILKILSRIGLRLVIILLALWVIYGGVIEALVYFGALRRMLACPPGYFPREWIDTTRYEPHWFRLILIYFRIFGGMFIGLSWVVAGTGLMFLRERLRKYAFGLAIGELVFRHIWFFVIKTVYFFSYVHFTIIIFILSQNKINMFFRAKRLKKYV